MYNHSGNYNTLIAVAQFGARIHLLGTLLEEPSQACLNYGYLLVGFDVRV